jgi:hypothetical protein
MEPLALTPVAVSTMSDQVYFDVPANKGHRMEEMPGESSQYRSAQEK